jgi:hypothetical protein
MISSLLPCGIVVEPFAENIVGNLAADCPIQLIFKRSRLELLPAL